MNSKAEVGTQDMSGARGTLHTPALPSLGFQQGRRKQHCTLRGYSPAQEWGFLPAACGTPAFRST